MKDQLISLAHDYYHLFLASGVEHSIAGMGWYLVNSFQAMYQVTPLLSRVHISDFVSMRAKVIISSNVIYVPEFFGRTKTKR